MEASAIGSTPYEIMHNIGHAYVGIGNTIYNLVTADHSSRPKIACASGCSDCCRLNSTVQTRTKSNAVGMTLLDGVGVLEYFSAIAHTPAARQVHQQVIHRWQQLPQTLERLPCPFVAMGNCVIYAARPMVCRLYFSNNATHCAIQADIPADQRQVDSAIAKTVRSIRRDLNAQARQVLQTRLPDATFGYFDFMTTAHTIVDAVMNDQAPRLQSAINVLQHFPHQDQGAPAVPTGTPVPLP